MRQIQLLDCTLRDGGFVNDWKFGYNAIRDILTRLVKSGVEIIEVGFIDERRAFDKNHSIFPTAKSSDAFLENIDFGDTMVVGMIDFGTCPIENICSSEECALDGLRVIFKKQDIPEALKYCGQLKDKGYHVFVQPVSITSYTDLEILHLIESVNALEPYALSIVDTYGLMLKEDLLPTFHLFDRNLSPSIRLGYHAHNNFQLAYANCAELLRYHSSRDIVIDASLYGMGKSAGNANIELLITLLNSHFDKKYDLNQVLECIDTNILRIYEQSPWGYQMKYFLSASNDCHSGYISWLMQKGTLSVKSINEIVSMIPKATKLTYKKELIEKLYQQYQQKEIDDTFAVEQIKEKLQGKSILILAPGHTLITHREPILEYICSKKPIVISSNFIPVDYSVSYTFVSNSKRYIQMADAYLRTIQKPQIIATSNIEESTIPLNFILNYESLLISEAENADNSVLLLLSFLSKVDCLDIVVAGFDGYLHGAASNYLDDYFDLSVHEEKYNVINMSVIKALSMQKLPLKFLTPSIYDKTNIS